MIFCARATRGRGRPSLGLMARLGVPVGGRVRKLRAVKGSLGRSPRGRYRELGSVRSTSKRTTKLPRPLLAALPPVLL